MVRILNTGSFSFLTLNKYYTALDACNRTDKVLVEDDNGTRIWLDSYQFTF